MKTVMPLILLFATSMSACVEIKDPDLQAGQLAPIEASHEPKNFNRLVVDQPLILWQQQILTLDEAAQIDLSSRVGGVWTYHFDELQILPGGVIYTYGETVHLLVENLISEGSLATFPEGTTAREGRPGRHGGAINLQIKTISGHLQVELRGENGGPGENGKSSGTKDCHKYRLDPTTFKTELLSFAQGQPGGRGGDSGRIMISQRSDQPAPFEIRKIPGAGGRGGNPLARSLVRCPLTLPPNKNIFQESNVGRDGENGREEEYCFQRENITCR